MSTCCARPKEIRGAEERVPRADGRGWNDKRTVGEAPRMQKKWKEYQLADSAGHDDERVGGESRAIGIKSSSNIGVPDRRGRELINCRNGGT